MKVRFYKAAVTEFDEAIAYYENQLQGLGSRYHEAVKDAVEHIKSLPEAYFPFSKYPVSSEFPVLIFRPLAKGFPANKTIKT